jgi:hypothetical protein
MTAFTRRIMLGGTAAIATTTALDCVTKGSAEAATANLRVGNTALIEGSFGKTATRPGNFEALLLNGNNLSHYWRDNSPSSGFPWHQSVVVSSASTGPACLIEGSYGKTATNPGNFEALVLEGSNLWHYWRDNTAGGSLPWHRSVVVSNSATGPATLIQSSFRGTPTSPGNFEALVPEGNNLVHYWRDNTAGGSLPWHRGAVVSTTSTGPASLIEGSYGKTATNPGNFEALVLEGSNLWHYWRDNTAGGSLPWHRSVVVSGTATGPGTLIQNGFRGTASSPGNFEALVPQGNNLWHYWRDNTSGGALPWHPSVIVSSAARGPATLIEGSFKAPGRPGNFEALVQEAYVVHYWRDNGPGSLPWHSSVAI